jgi:TolB-like protein
MNQRMSFFSELKRRNVVRMGVLYIVVSWLTLQISDVIFDPLGVPSWVFRLLMSLLALGFPFALIFSWIFELTPEGVKRERDIDRSQSIVHETGHRMNTVIVVLLVLAIGGLIADRLVPETVAPGDAEPDSAGVIEKQAASAATVDENSVSAEDDNSIAVLPFVNMSGDPDNEYFSDGLTEELLNSLVRIGGLKVTGRTSSFAFKGQNLDLREIGRLLNVANVLEGSVRKAGNRVRITTQLVKVSDGYHLWSDTFDRELDDIFAIQAEIADQVTKSLHVTLLGGEQADQPVVGSAAQNAEAYEEYLRGMYVLQHDPDGEEALELAKGHFSRAIDIDPGYVDGYWGLISTWDRINRNGYVLFSESIGHMQHYNAELQRLAPGSERALNAAGRIAIVLYDYERAAMYLEEAASRYPGSATTLARYGSYLQLANSVNGTGDVNQSLVRALRVIDNAVQLDPLSLEILRIRGNILVQMGDCDGLAKTRDNALELDPDAGRFSARLAKCIYETEGDVNRALLIAESEPLGFAHYTLLAIFHHALGDPELAKQYLDHMYASYGDSAAYQYGQIHAQWGEPELALTWLETALDIHDPGIILSGNDRLLDPLRDEPRFQKILEAAGFR